MQCSNLVFCFLSFKMKKKNFVRIRAIHACEDARFLRKDPRLSAAHGVHEIFARQISAADVLRERERDRVREILNSEVPRLRPRLSRCARI